MKNICIYTLGRSGSNYLRSFIEQPEYILLNEPFTLSSRHNAAQFLMGMSLLYQKEKIDLSHLKDLIYLALETQSSTNIIGTTLLEDKLLKLWFSEKQKLTPKNILWKFMAWYHSSFNLNIHNMFDTIDYLILNYRKNILKQWISSIKAKKTGEWITDKKFINHDTQILWNKVDYLNFVAYTEKHHSFMKMHFGEFNKSKTIICYENLSDPNNGGVSYLNSKFQKANIDLPINDSILIQRQSDPNKPLEDNFFNKQEFLKDYDSIKDQISTNIIFN
jgi:hypothetical protein